MSITRFPALTDIHGISIDQLRSKVPALFAKGPSPKMSERYTFVSSISLVEELISAGYLVTHATQRAVLPGGRDQRHTRHMLRFRNSGIKPVLDGIFPEVVLINSHDGQSRYQLYSGIFRTICRNGLVLPLGDSSVAMARVHLGDIESIMTESRKALTKSVESIKFVNCMRSRKFNEAQSLKFAKEAMAIAYDKDSTIDPKLLLNARREEDAEPTLWNVFNRVQENIIRGGLDVKHGERTFHTRGITHIGRLIEVNLKLWELAEKFGRTATKKAT